MRILAELTKFRITLLTTLSGFLAYFLYQENLEWNIVFLVIGLWALASGASVLNQVQESDFDALMSRTKNRPIPSGRISKKYALLISIAFMILGIGILFNYFGFIPAVLGAFAVIWYNGVYTTLKRITPYAIVPGSLIGALPSAIGWTAAGGNLTDPRIVFIMIYFFVWQIPHFWLLLLSLSEQYEVAGFPSLLRILNKNQMSRIIFIWTLSIIVISLMMPLYGLITNVYLFGLFVMVAFWVIYHIRFLLKIKEFSIPKIRKAFMMINVYTLSFMLVLFIQYSIHV